MPSDRTPKETRLPMPRDATPNATSKGRIIPDVPRSLESQNLVKRFSYCGYVRWKCQGPSIVVTLRAEHKIVRQTIGRMKPGKICIFSRQDYYFAMNHNTEICTEPFCSRSNIDAYACSNTELY